MKHNLALRMLAARAVVHCPRDLAEAICRELGIPMPESYVDQLDNFATWRDPATAQPKEDT